MKTPKFVDVPAVEGNVYLTWCFEYLRGNMGAADYLFLQRAEEIRRVAGAAFAAARPWGARPRETVYRGIRLHDPTLRRGSTLPPYTGRVLPDGRAERVASFSFSSSRDVACYFADPAGMPSVEDGALGTVPLGAHGYVVELTARPADVLFHHAYLRAFPVFARVFAPLPGGYDLLVQQREVTIENRADLPQTVEGVFDDGDCAGYARPAGAADYASGMIQFNWS